MSLRIGYTYMGIPDRARRLPEIFNELQKYAQKGLRVGQVFYNIKTIMGSDGIDMYYAENDLLLEYLKDYNNGEL